ncbi:MAG: hypothetical protein R3D33_06105 [Hyphomicrobiaceae bacterium]
MKTTILALGIAALSTLATVGTASADATFQPFSGKRGDTSRHVTVERSGSGQMMMLGSGGSGMTGTFAGQGFVAGSAAGEPSMGYTRDLRRSLGRVVK